MHLNQTQVVDYIGKLSEQLTKKQADTIEVVAKLLSSSQEANLGKVLTTVYPGKDDKEALNSLRVLRSQVKTAARAGSIEFDFCVDTEKRKKPEQRICWFEGIDLSAEKMEQMQKELLRDNPEYQFKDFTPPLARSRYRIFVSSSDNRGADAPTDEERGIIEDFLRRLRISLKGLNRYDLADGMYHFREQQDNLMFERIEKAMDGCEVGLLLFSKPYMASKYIKESELPRFDPGKYRTGVAGTKDSIPLLLSPCYDNDPARINEILGLAEGGGLQILRHKDKLSFSECDERVKEQFVEMIAGRLHKKLPPFNDPGVTLPKRRDNLDTFTTRHWDKLNADSSYNPFEWEPTRGECCFMGRVASSVQPNPEPAEEQPKGFDALDRLVDWAIDPNSAHVHAVLGDLGSGKTFTCRMLAMRLLEMRMHGNNSAPLPIYIDLREVGFASEWQTAPKLDNILEGWLTNWQRGINPEEQHGLDLAAIKRLSLCGAVWIFDGFDEISSHLPRNGDNAFFKELLRPVAPEKGKPSKSKVLISCRSHYFPTLAKQNATLLEEARGILRPGLTRPDNDENPELICDSTLLLPFEENQIKSYLTRTLGEAEADRAMEVIAGIHDLTELSRQPYLLRLIREQIARLEIMKSQGKPVNTASLYGLFVADWLQRDEGKHTIEPEDKLRLMERLAAQMWSDRQRGWTYEQLQRWALVQMENEPDWRFRYQQHAELIAKDLHTAAFIVRYGESSFRFIHTSMQEYFVAAHLLRGLLEQRFYHWDLAKVSPETLSFLADLWQLCPAHEHAILFQAQRQVHATPPSPDAALLALDYLLTARQKGWPHVLPDTLDLSGADIGQRTLSGQTSQPWVINLFRINNANAPQIQMWHLHIKRLEAQHTRLVGSRWQYCTVEAANFEHSDLGGIQIRHCNWREVSLSQTSLRYAELRLSRFDLQPTTDPIEISGPVWWLNSLPTPLWATSPHASATGSTLSLGRLGHSSEINLAAWSCNRQQLALAGEDGRIYIWDTTNGVCLMNLKGHESEICSLEWHTDKRQLASAGYDGAVRIWDIDTGACIMNFQGYEGVSTAMTWCNDGLKIASVNEEDAIRIWDANGTHLITKQLHEKGASYLAWRSDGQQLASAERDGTVRIWDITNGTCIILQAHEDGATAVAWRNDGLQLVSTGNDGKVCIWDTATGDCLITWQGHEEGICAVAWRNDGQQIATSSWDETMRIWDITSGACLMTFEGDDIIAMYLAWHSDGRQFVSAGWYESVRIWDATSGVCLLDLQGQQIGISAVAWRNDGQQFATSGRDGTINIWNAINGTCLMTLKGNGNRINSLIWRSNDQLLFSSGYYGPMRIWDVAKGVCLTTLQPHKSISSVLAWRSDGQQLATLEKDGLVHIREVASGDCLLSLHAPESRIYILVWCTDGKRIATSGWDEAAQIWDATTGACLLTLQTNKSKIRVIEWRNDGQQLASGDEDGTIRIWDAVTGTCVMTLQGHTHDVISIAWRYDNQQLVSTGHDGLIHIWDVVTGTCLMTLQGQQRTINAVAWSSDGQKLASVGRDGTVCIWNATVGTLLYQCVAFGDVVALLNDRGEVIKANDDAWPYLARMGINPETGERMWIPAEIDEIGQVI
jgi:WD40 repeat protein